MYNAYTKYLTASSIVLFFEHSALLATLLTVSCLFCCFRLCRPLQITATTSYQSPTTPANHHYHHHHHHHHSSTTYKPPTPLTTTTNNNNTQRGARSASCSPTRPATRCPAARRWTSWGTSTPRSRCAASTRGTLSTTGPPAARRRRSTAWTWTCAAETAASWTSTGQPAPAAHAMLPLCDVLYVPRRNDMLLFGVVNRFGVVMNASTQVPPAATSCFCLPGAAAHQPPTAPACFGWLGRRSVGSVCWPSCVIADVGSSSAYGV